VSSTILVGLREPAASHAKTSRDLRPNGTYPKYPGLTTVGVFYSYEVAGNSEIACKTKVCPFGKSKFGYFADFLSQQYLHFVFIPHPAGGKPRHI